MITKSYLYDVFSCCWIYFNSQPHLSMRNIVDLLWHPGFNNSLDAGDFLHGIHYTEELVDTYLQLNKKSITFQDDLQFTSLLVLVEAYKGTRRKHNMKFRQIRLI